MDKGLDEVKSMLLSYDSRLRSLEMSSSATKPLNDLLTDRVRGHDKKIDQHAEDLNKLFTLVREQGDALGRVTSILRWLLTIVTALIVAVAVALLTGKASIVFRP